MPFFNIKDFLGGVNSLNLTQKMPKKREKMSKKASE